MRCLFFAKYLNRPNNIGTKLIERISKISSMKIDRNFLKKSTLNICFLCTDSVKLKPKSRPETMRYLFLILLLKSLNSIYPVIRDIIDKKPCKTVPY